MTRDEQEATLMLHGWTPCVTSMGNYAWVRGDCSGTGEFEAIGVDSQGRVFSANGPFYHDVQLPIIRDLSFHNIFGKIMSIERHEPVVVLNEIQRRT